MQLGVDSLQHDDAWLVAAIAVALSPENGVVAHGDLKQAFALWRGVEEHSDGAFDRNVLRPALASRGMEPGPRVNKIVCSSSAAAAPPSSRRGCSTTCATAGPLGTRPSGRRPPDRLDP